MKVSLQKVKRFFIGKPLSNELQAHQKMSVGWGLPVLASDAVSSVAYAGQEMLLTLVPVIGILAFAQVGFLSLAIVALLLILTFSYKQTIDTYPNGGGAYIVSKTNLGTGAGTVAGSALAVDYIMTVAVSISSGIAQISSAFPSIEHFKIPIALVLIALLMLGNLRGIRESSRIFGLPTYAFALGILSMIVIGLYKYFTHAPMPIASADIIKNTGPITLFLLLRAFSNGCSALTGIEAVSNAVPQMKDPSQKHAKRTLYLLSFMVLVLFAGTSLLVRFYPLYPKEGEALLVIMAKFIFGDHSFMLYAISFTTFLILFLASNTAYSGFPTLLSVIAKDGYVPRQLSFKGDRLSYSNGIILLSVISAVLIVIFNGNVTALIGLYAIGVFLSFTLSQVGMTRHWFKEKQKGWRHKATINIVGATMTGVAVLIIGITKFSQGAWIVIILVPLLAMTMMRVRKHYDALKKQLVVTPEDLSHMDIDHDRYEIRVIVPISGVNKVSIRAIRYAETISNNVTAFHVAIDEERAQKIKAEYELLHTQVPLEIKYSPVRKVIEPLMEYVDQHAANRRPGQLTVIVLSEFRVKKWWHRFLHNGTVYFMERQLRKYKHIVVSIIPLQLKDDKDFKN